MRVPSFSWHALRVFSNRERAVNTALDRLGIEAFLPLYTVETRWTDRRKTIERPLFPGYIFARFHEVSPVLEVAGVCGVLGGNFTPSPIPNHEIDHVRIVISSLLPLSPADYVSGDKVTIRSGALRGVSGVVLRHSGGVRLIVSVEMLHRAVAVELTADMLAKEKCQ